VATQTSDPATLARLMMGRDIALEIAREPCRPGRAVLEVRNLGVTGNRKAPAIGNLELTVHRGEIVGIAGVDGNGQTELAEAICGVRHAFRGAICLNGENLTNLSPEIILKKGIACLPADRRAAAMVESFSMHENALLGFSHAAPFAKHGLLDLSAVWNFTADLIRQYQVKVDSPGTPIRNLSGGHQQRFVFGRTIHHDPDLLIAAQPTRGLDLISSDFVHRKLLELRNAGKAILLISMDLDEVMMLSDRIEVIHGGEIMGSADANTSRQEIGLMMGGVRRQTAARPVS
jgi:ABC-type uncharacterized transport system ATPase subunit